MSIPAPLSFSGSERVFRSLVCQRRLVDKLHTQIVVRASLGQELRLITGDQDTHDDL